MTAEDLTTLSPAQLDKMSKADIIAKILDGVTHTTSTLIEEDSKLGPIRKEETTTDAYGKLLGTRIIEYTYYLTGEVDEITVEEGEERLVVKHFTDGRQPVGTKTVISKVATLKAAVSKIFAPEVPTSEVLVELVPEVMDADVPLTMGQAFVADIKGAGQLFVEDLRKLGKSIKKLVS